MSTSGDAERLLNTIVAARVRLSSLRNGPDLQKEVRAAPLESSQFEPTTAAHTPPSLPSGSTSAPSSHQHKDASSEFQSQPSQQNYDLEPPLVLGIDPSEMESRKTIEETTHPVFEIPGFDADFVDTPSISQEVEEDPFSFIDLLPPQDAIESRTPPQIEEEQPSLEPPPVRPKPKMPLPLGIAIGAPVRDIKTTAHSPVQPKKRETDKPAQPPQNPPTSTQTTVDISSQLSQPRPVQPRVLDPNRSGLVVDVFENELRDTPNPYPAAAAPRLTDGDATKSAPRQTTETVRSEDDLFDLITEASAHLGRGDIQTAHMLFSDVLDWLPSHLEARLARGRCSRDMGDIVSAHSDFQRAKRHNPLSPGPHLELGDLFFAKKDYLRAISHYDDALSIDPSHALTLCRRGICHHHRKRADKAIDDLTLARKLNPDIPNIDRYIRMVTP